MEKPAIKLENKFFRLELSEVAVRILGNILISIILGIPLAQHLPIA
jgi:hypothetical protein